MTIRVLMFAALAQRAGVRDVALALPTGATVGDALTQLRERFAGLSGFAGKITPAVNQEYVAMNHSLREGDELALVTPVSGG